MKAKHFLVLGLVLLVIAFVLYLQDRASNIQDYTNSSVLTLAPTPKVTDDPENDGGPIVTISEKERRILNLMADLRKKLPIENDNFKISYDYRNAHFLIKIKSLNGKEEFLKWLEEQGYGAVLDKYFVFE